MEGGRALAEGQRPLGKGSRPLLPPDKMGQGLIAQRYYSPVSWELPWICYINVANLSQVVGRSTPFVGSSPLVGLLHLDPLPICPRRLSRRHGVHTVRCLSLRLRSWSMLGEIFE